MSQRKPGLWHGPRRVEITDVKKAHRTPCLACGVIPKFRRMEVTEGAGRSAKKYILCIEHAEEWILARREESLRALDYLGRSTIPIRKNGPDPAWMANLKIREEEAKERKRLKAAIAAPVPPQTQAGSLSQAIKCLPPRRRQAP